LFKQIPEVDGCEATKKIRMEEKSHGMHIHIFAQTAHAMSRVTSEIVDTGMDFHSSKSLEVDILLDAVRLFCTECK
jgi:two-component system, sensor histidine kinase